MAGGEQQNQTPETTNATAPSPATTIMAAMEATDTSTASTTGGAAAAAAGQERVVAEKHGKKWVIGTPNNLVGPTVTPVDRKQWYVKDMLGNRVYLNSGQGRQ
jgi:hypothetical protein